MTETELFAAYRHVDHWESECACGELIVSERGDELSVASAIEIHNESTVHAQWRSWQEAVRSLQRPTRRKCPCGGEMVEKSLSDGISRTVRLEA